MSYQYQLIFTESYKPDLTEVNELAKEGWELLQIGSASSSGTAAQWFYLLRSAGPVEETTNDSDVNVAGAGSSGCDGTYVKESEGVWRQPASAYYVSRVDGYPNPGEPGWAIRRDSTIHYAAPDCPFPWDAVWQVSLGTAPVPTVTEEKAESRK